MLIMVCPVIGYFMFTHSQVFLSMLITSDKVLANGMLLVTYSVSLYILQQFEDTENSNTIQ